MITKICLFFLLAIALGASDASPEESKDNYYRRL